MSGWEWNVGLQPHFSLTLDKACPKASPSCRRGLGGCCLGNLLCQYRWNSWGVRSKCFSLVESGNSGFWALGLFIPIGASIHSVKLDRFLSTEQDAGVESGSTRVTTMKAFSQYTQSRRWEMNTQLTGTPCRRGNRSMRYKIFEDT